MTEDWASRIGTTAALSRGVSSGATRVAIGLAIATVVFAVAAVVGLLLVASSTLVVVSPAFFVPALLSAVVAFSCSTVALAHRLDSEDETWLNLWRAGLPVTARDVAMAMRSTSAFDASMAQWKASDPVASQRPVHWSPNLRRAILPGPSARILLTLAHVFEVVGLVLSFIPAGFGAGGDFLTPVLWATLWSVALTVLGVGVLLWALALWRNNVEYRHGYMTAAVGGFWMRIGTSMWLWDLRLPVDRVDARTGYILRSVGEDRLTYDSYLNRRYAIREAHPHARPQWIEKRSAAEH